MPTNRFDTIRAHTDYTAIMDAHCKGRVAGAREWATRSEARADVATHGRETVRRMASVVGVSYSRMYDAVGGVQPWQDSASQCFA